MRLGLFGGSFDPVHYGHLLLAECCREQCRLDAVWFLPAAVPPHKQDRELTPAAAADRHARTGHRRQSGLRGVPLRDRPRRSELHGRHACPSADEDPGRQLFFLLGADMLRTCLIGAVLGGCASWPCRLPLAGPVRPDRLRVAGDCHRGADRAYARSPGRDAGDRHRRHRVAPPGPVRPEHSILRSSCCRVIHQDQRIVWRRRG